MARSSVTSTDVARAAGVSQSAVSRAFSPHAVISARTRERVQAVARELGYRPNALARSLITRRSHMIALVSGDLDNPFYAVNVQLLSARLQARGYHVLLFTVTGDEQVDQAVADLLRYRVDGVLLASAALSADMAEACERQGTPVVLYNRYARSPNVSSVRVENSAGGRRLADYLVDGGHSRIGFIAGTAVDETGADRERGFTDRLRERGVPLTARAAGDYTFVGGHHALIELWEAGVRLDALFAASDLMALGAMDAARATLGLSVPTDLSIVGFDDLPMARWPSYMLTTMRQPVERLAAAAVDLLLEKIEVADVAPRTILVPAALNERESARMPG